MQLRHYLPKTLFNRLVAIILVPMFLVQLITVLIFYERHWDSITRQMADALASEIRLLVDRLPSEPTSENIENLKYFAKKYFYFDIKYVSGATMLPKDIETNSSYTAFAFKRAINSRIRYPWTASLEDHSEKILVDMQFPNGVLTISAGKKRLFSSTSWLFIGWTTTSTSRVSISAFIITASNNGTFIFISFNKCLPP